MKSLLILLLLTTLLVGQEIKLRFEPGLPDHPAIKIEGDTATISHGGDTTLQFVSDTPFDPKATVLEFEVFSLGGCEDPTVLLSSSSGHSTAVGIPEISHGEALTTYAAQLADGDQPIQPWQTLALNLSLKPEAVIKISKVRIRRPRPDEFAVADQSAVGRRSQLIERYLESTPDYSVDQVGLSDSEVRVDYTVGSGAANLFVAEIPIHRSLDDPSRFESLTPITAESEKTSSISLPRYLPLPDGQYDRLTSRWQIVRNIDGEHHPVSHARYADHFPSAHPDLPEVALRNAKGLGGWDAQRQPKGDLETLGVSAITINVHLDSLLYTSPNDHTTPFLWRGKTYHANNNALDSFDATLIEASKHQVLVSAVLLVSNPNRSEGHPWKTMNPIGHPDADPSAIFAMPAMDRRESVDTYGAIIYLLATRYSRPDQKFGRIHHYIVHNEVDAGWTWTNCGEKPLPYFFDLYHRSMRLIDLITRSQNPNARAFISLTHHWTEAGSPKYYGSKKMLVELAKWTRTEGDFPWALAHHPYPTSLMNPRTWEDPVSFDFDTNRITPRNIEVLDAWMRRPEMLDKDGNTRPVHLSENGFNSPDYSEKSLTDQAAGMAYAWKKITPLETIKVWHYHNWIDNRHEGGLRIGLRRFPDDKEDPLGEKPIFKLYRDLATPKEDAACAPYLPVVGLKSWSEAIHRGSRF